MAPRRSRDQVRSASLHRPLSSSPERASATPAEGPAQPAFPRSPGQRVPTACKGSALAPASAWNALPLPLCLLNSLSFRSQLGHPFLKLPHQIASLMRHHVSFPRSPSNSCSFAFMIIGLIFISPSSLSKGVALHEALSSCLLLLNIVSPAPNEVLHTVGTQQMSVKWINERLKMI